MSELVVEVPGTPERSYPVHVDAGLLEHPVELLPEGGRRWAVVSDANVAERWARPLVTALREAGSEVSLHEIAPGEGSKHRGTVAEVQDSMIEAGVRRDGRVMAVGGGVVGDVAGFAAASLFRGVPYVRVPTSLLAMVDSSVGGKTGVDTPAGKNLVGAFHQPQAVIADVATLDSLPDVELAAGMAEVIKHGVILDEGLFTELEDGLLESCVARVPAALVRVVERSVRLKAEVVGADEREGGIRKILNFGHTVGHGIETSTGYAIRHGEAVAVGMVAEARIAADRIGAPAELAGRIEELCRRAGLPTEPPPGCDVDAVIEAAAMDKKVRGGRIRCSLPVEIGRMARDDSGDWTIEVTAGDLRRALTPS